MLWVLKRTVSYIKINGSENIYTFTLKVFVYLDVCIKTEDKKIFNFTLKMLFMGCIIFP